MTKLIETVQSSELSRNPLKVFSAAEHNPITVTRRDGEDLVLMKKKEVQDLKEFQGLISQILVVLDDDTGSLIERMSKPFPWILALSQKDQFDCANDLVRAAKVALATNVPSHALNNLLSWQATAETVALGIDFDNIERLKEPILVERP